MLHYEVGGGSNLRWESMGGSISSKGKVRDYAEHSKKREGGGRKIDHKKEGGEPLWKEKPKGIPSIFLHHPIYKEQTAEVDKKSWSNFYKSGKDKVNKSGGGGQNPGVKRKKHSGLSNVLRPTQKPGNHHQEKPRL